MFAPHPATPEYICPGWDAMPETRPAARFLSTLLISSTQSRTDLSGVGDLVSSSLITSLRAASPASFVEPKLVTAAFSLSMNVGGDARSSATGIAGAEAGDLSCWSA